MHQRRVAPDKRAAKAKRDHREFIELHLAAKNVQSIRQTSRCEDFMNELDQTDYDILFLSETWRSDPEEILSSPNGDMVYLSGGAASKGVCICISRRMMRLIHKISFHGISNRVCMLQFSMAERDFQVFACYFPTPWDPVADVEELYQLVTMFVDSGQATNVLVTKDEVR